MKIMKSKTKNYGPCLCFISGGKDGERSFYQAVQVSCGGESAAICNSGGLWR